MAHFAKLDQNNIVIEVLVVHNNDAPNEAAGQQFLKDHGYKGKFIATSYNNNIRKNFAGIGYVYDPDKDAFIAPKPFDSWILDEDSCRWEAPIAYPSDGKPYRWDEETTSWVAAFVG